ncbi:MAG: hypothetical protein E6J79_03620 [Deltaproteobacteria bacterium]|nr:MAG: hypothetical protein E6J79_03620 [Deltaproteobacteria bacterium]
MTASERANLPRWRGQAGFVEIWFLVVFHPPTESALWLRYTTFAPARSAPGVSRAIVWAAWFDARPAAPAVALKAIHPAAAYDAGQPGRFGIRIGSCVLEQGYVAGAVAGGGRRLVWDLAFIPAERPAESEPWLLRQLPLPVRVSRPNADTVFSGTITIDGVARRLEASPGLQTHIWGTRHVEELAWLYCPAFAEDPSARLEAASARLDRRVLGPISGPWLTPVVWRSAEGDVALTGLIETLRNRIAVSGPTALELRAGAGRDTISARAWCAPESLVGYVYRDPGGRELHVAQSDVASCEVEVVTRGGRRRLTSRCTTAVEFHAPEPLPGVRYIPWDAETPPSAR